MLLSGAAVAGLASATNASMVVGLRAIGTYADTNFTNFQPLGGTDTPLSVAATPGKVVSLGVFATVTQTGAVGDPSAGGTGWPVFSSAGGRIVSTPTGAARGNIFGNFLDGSVSGNGSSSGDFKDLDGDTDLDNGNTDANSANPAGWVLYRGATGSGEIGPGSNLLVGANTQSIYGNKPNGTPGTPTAITGGFEYYLGEVDYVVTATGGLTDGSNLVWQFRPQTGNATWFENATRTVNSKNGLTTFTNGTTGTTFSSGPAVLIGGGVPEPASLGLASLAGLALLARRGKKD